MPLPKEINTGFKLEEELLWAEKLPKEEVSLDLLDNNLDILYLESEGTDDWNMSPRMLLANYDQEHHHRQTLIDADMQFPIEIYFFKGQWIILDGVHRFTKAHFVKQKTICVRKITESVVAATRKSPEDYLRWQGL